VWSSVFLRCGPHRWLCRDGTAQEEGPDGDVLREKALWELLALFFVEAPRAIGGVTEVPAFPGCQTINTSASASKG